MTLVKICGVTRPDDAAHAATAGADFVGLNFWPRSKRYLAPAHAADVAAAARAASARVAIVGVFVDPSPADVRAALDAVALDALQLHGSETPAHLAAIAAVVASHRAGAATRDPAIWKALAVASAADLDGLDAWAAAAALLFDAPSAARGGSGTTFDWRLAAAARARDPERAVLLAGGLTPDNVAAAIRAVAPWAVDVASGVESAPGIKDPDKVAAFIAAARGLHA